MECFSADVESELEGSFSMCKVNVCDDATWFLKPLLRQVNARRNGIGETGK